MTFDSDSYGEMHLLPFQNPPFSDDTAEGLLSGRIAPSQAPAPLRGLASLFETAAGAAKPEETAHQATVVAAAIAAMEEATPVHSACPAPDSRRRFMPSKLLTAKAAAVATIAAFGLGTAAAAATGALSGGHASSNAASGLAIAASASSGANSGGNGNGQGQSSSGHNSTGAALNPNAQFGLCTAFLAHHPSSVNPPTSAPSDSSRTFSALIAKKGGGTLAGTITYCNGVISTHNTAAGTGDSTDNNAGKSSGTANKPSNAGPPSSKPPVSTPNSGGSGTADTASDQGTGAAGTTPGGAAGSAGSANSSGH